MTDCEKRHAGWVAVKSFAEAVGGSLRGGGSWDLVSLPTEADMVYGIDLAGRVAVRVKRFGQMPDTGNWCFYIR